MSDDSKERILADWNASDEARGFSNFKDLFDYLEGMSKEMGKQSKKEIYKHPNLASNRFPQAREAIQKKAKIKSKNTTIRVADFRHRIKLLSRSRKSLTSQHRKDIIR